MPKMPTLTIIEGDVTREYIIDKPEMTIGRSPECDIRLHSQWISRSHARLEITPEGVRLIKCGKNSIEIFKERVEHSVLLQNDDRIDFSGEVTGFYYIKEINGDSPALVPSPKPLKYL